MGKLNEAARWREGVNTRVGGNFKTELKKLK